MDDLLTFAIGDVHGCFNKLQALLLFCDRARASREARYIFIGDYIDKGPDARRVVDLLMQKQLEEGRRFICLRGNHERAHADTHRGSSAVIPRYGHFLIRFEGWIIRNRMTHYLI